MAGWVKDARGFVVDWVNGRCMHCGIERSMTQVTVVMEFAGLEVGGWREWIECSIGVIVCFIEEMKHMRTMWHRLVEELQ